MDNDSTQEKLSFENTLINHWDYAERRTDKGRQLAKNLEDFLHERAALESTYATSLERLANKLISYELESNGMKETVKALQTETLRRAEQSKVLSDSIYKDVIYSTLSLTINNHAKTLNVIRNDAGLLLKALRQAYHNTQTSEHEISNIGKNLLEKLIDFKKMEAAIASIQLRKASEILKTILKLEKAESIYAEQVNQLKLIQSRYEKNMKLILASLQDMDRKRLCCFQDALRKLMVYEASYLRNVQYDLDIAIHTVERMDCDEEIQEFLLNAKKTLPCLPLFSKPVVRNWCFLSLAVPRELEAPTLTSNTRFDSASPLMFLPSLEAARHLLQGTALDKVVQSATMHLINFSTDYKRTYEEENSEGCSKETAEKILSPKSLCTLISEPSDNLYNTSSVLERLQNFYDKLLDTIWNFNKKNNSEFLFTQTQNLLGELSSSFHRSVLIKRLIYRFFNKQTELSSEDGLQILSIICLRILDFSQSQWDVISGVALMILSQKFYAKTSVQYNPSWEWPHLKQRSQNLVTNFDEPNNKSLPSVWFLHRALYNSNFWNHVHFWSEALEFVLSLEYQERVLADTEIALRTLFPTEYNPASKSTITSASSNTVASSSQSVPHIEPVETTITNQKFQQTENQITLSEDCSMPQKDSTLPDFFTSKNNQPCCSSNSPRSCQEKDEISASFDSSKPLKINSKASKDDNNNNLKHKFELPSAEQESLKTVTLAKSDEVSSQYSTSLRDLILKSNLLDNFGSCMSVFGISQRQIKSLFEHIVLTYKLPNTMESRLFNSLNNPQEKNNISFNDNQFTYLPLTSPELILVISEKGKNSVKNIANPVDINVSREVFSHPDLTFDTSHLNNPPTTTNFIPDAKEMKHVVTSRTVFDD